MLHLSGYEEFTMEELKRFRQVGSKTPGHPENVLTNGGIEVTTGPLGQGLRIQFYHFWYKSTGFANAVGLAICQAHLAAVFNKEGFPLITNHTYVFCGDGCLQEGVSAEAASLAGHLGLNKLIVFYDDNKITIDGETELAFTEDVALRFKAYGWHTITVEKGSSLLFFVLDIFFAHVYILFSLHIWMHMFLIAHELMNLTYSHYVSLHISAYDSHCTRVHMSFHY